ncbi:MAG: DEAD/DEAH box helicase [Promethearchaeia archaeon]
MKSKKNLPSSASFFILWHPLVQSEELLAKKISQVFPEIPVQKLLLCKLNLAFLEAKANNSIFRIKDVLAKIVPLKPGLELLLNQNLFPEGFNKKENSMFSPSVRTWTLLTKFVFELLNKGRFIPTLQNSETHEDHLEGHWRLVLNSEGDKSRLKKIMNAGNWISFNLPLSADKNTGMISQLWHPSYLYSEFIDNIGDYLIRSIINQGKFNTFKEFYNFEVEKDKKNESSLAWDYKFLKSLLRKDNKFSVTKFHETIVQKLINDWTRIASLSSNISNFSMTFKLNYPETSQDQNSEDWMLDLAIKLANKENLIPIKKIWENSEMRESLVNKLHINEKELIETILLTITDAAKIFSPIEKSLMHQTPQHVPLTSNEVMEFLRYPKDVFIQNGINVILPDVFKTGGSQRMMGRLVINTKSDIQEELEKNQGRINLAQFNLDALLDFEWEVKLGEEEITPGELEEILQKESPLIKWRDQWVLVDKKDLHRLQDTIQEGSIAQDLNYIDALRVGLQQQIEIGDGEYTYDVIVEGYLEEIIDTLSSIGSFESIETPNLFQGQLRPYQQKGLTWMVNMTKYNFGLCLADDMGLGKTIQIIAFLLHLKETYPEIEKSTLIICPTSVLFNWKRELKRFAPDLETVVHHGPDRVSKPSELKDFLRPHRVILTTFGTIRNDIDLLEPVSLHGVIVDEVQNIKNISSQQTQAVMKLQGDYRIGLSGTPIQNQLMELWTIFKFLNPGLLGSRQHFMSKYVIPIERFQDTASIQNLKNVINPFILRREKTDKDIIQDLPEKNEIKVYVELTEEQKALYQKKVNQVMNLIDNQEIDERKKRGSVLGLLMKLKQICNHPIQFLDGSIPEFKSQQDVQNFLKKSQKLKRLVEMMDEVLGKNEKALIFTQFRKTGQFLKKVLENYYDINVLYFHGGVPEYKRKEIVDEFQSEDPGSAPILVLSLKAGGTGLNLTQGTTVFHFDRWWNPAVEAQATDRAYRIGQTDSVSVYKFVSLETIEEKIDNLLEEKKKLADQVIPGKGESWISDLSKDKLKQLFSL